MARFLIVLGLAILVVGLLWPYLSKLGLGRLPGDIVIERENGTVYVPLATCLLLSLLLSLVLWVVNRSGRGAVSDRGGRAGNLSVVRRWPGRRALDGGFGITAGTAECAWCAGRQGRGDRSSTARRGMLRR